MRTGGWKLTSDGAENREATTETDFFIEQQKQTDRKTAWRWRGRQSARSASLLLGHTRLIVMNDRT